MRMRKYLIVLYFVSFGFAQGQNKAINTNKLDELLSLKKQMINNHEIKSFYTIQLFSGQRQNAIKAKNEYDNMGLDYRAIIEYETPNYKVWVGRFRTKLYADKALAELKQDYPNALILRPGR